MADMSVLGYHANIEVWVEQRDDGEWLCCRLEGEPSKPPAGIDYEDRRLIASAKVRVMVSERENDPDQGVVPFGVIHDPGPEELARRAGHIKKIRR
jgi:hypothetical protein